MANHRHIGLRNSYAKQLFIHTVVTTNFLKSIQNLPNTLTKGPAMDLVWKTSKGMVLKPLENDHQC